MLWLELSLPTPYKKAESGRRLEAEPSTQPEFPPTAGRRHNEMLSAFCPLTILSLRLSPLASASPSLQI